MKNVTTFDNFPTFAENGSRNMNTEAAKYQIGFVEADTFPAEWANYLFHGATKGISDLNTAVQSIWQENVNVITQSGQIPNPNSTNQLYTAIQTFINNAILSANASILAQAKLDAHPVGSYYWSSDSTPPSTLFGGTWVEVKDKFIYAKGDSDTVGATGGSKTVALTEENIPSHTHSFTPSGTVSSHSHGLNAHAHYFTPSGSVNVTSNPDFSGNAVSDNFYPGQYGTPSDAGGTYFKYSDKNTGNQYGRRGADNSAQGLLQWNYTPSGSISGGSYSFSGSRALTESGGSGSTDSSTPSFSGTTGTTNPTGSGNAHNNMPPYEVAYCWRRIA